MKKIIIIALFALLGVSTTMQAQRKQYYDLGWDVAMPMGSFSDYVSNTSLRGGSFSGNIFLTDAFSFGFKFGYNSFSENVPSQTYYMKVDNNAYTKAVTAASYNYLVSAPMVIGGYYHFVTDGQIEPYIGLGLGVNYITEETLVQDLSIYDDQWAFVLNPEIGLRYQFANSPFALKLKAGYNFNVNEYQPWDKKYSNLQTLNVGLSLSWTIQ